MPPTYRRRLRVEGLILAGLGALGSIVLLGVSAQSSRGVLSTSGQLLILAVALGWLGPRATRRALDASVPRAGADLGSGEPTPMWHLALIVVTLALTAGLLAGWDAALRVTAGCVVVGLIQGLALQRFVAADEHRTGRTYFRIAGSRILRGTRLGYSNGPSHTGG